MKRFSAYLRGGLQRRIFLWFGASILVASITATLVTWIAAGLGEPTWRRNIDRGRSYLRGEFARVWDSPAEREAMARELSQTMETDVMLLDQDGRVIATIGNHVFYR